MLVVLPSRVPADVLQALERLLVLEELERGALAHRLHDGPLQDLVAARYLGDLALRSAGSLAEAGTVVERVTAARDATQDALAGSRRLLGQLTARCTDGSGLAPALAAIAAAASGDGLDVGLDVDPTLPTLPAGVAIVAHRLAQALLADAALRGASGAVLRAAITDGRLELAVSGALAPDLDEAAVARWVARVHLLGGTVSTGPAGSTAHFPLPVTATPDVRPAPEDL